MTNFASSLLGFGTTALLAAACGGTAPGTTPVANAQSAGMAQTFVGKNKCDPKSADRPFVVEWDATDMSSFEARAATDMIFVRYEGCDLKVIDACANDSVKGSLGSYKPVDWTSGSLESLDIANEGELYAKLPLGAATLGGRIQGGERFHMEYFVSGTRTATRDTVYRADLRKVAGCKGATHFVYAYNLGAFALGAQSQIKGEVGGSAFGFGAGGSRSSSAKADKQGGVLSTCRGASAKELQTCKVPVRLTLREISDGESADTTDSAAPETASAANLAGRLKASTDREKSAQEHAATARTMLSSRDGKGCLAELDRHDKLDPRPTGLSTNAIAPNAIIRSQCLMLAGQCLAGKDLYRKWSEKNAGGQMGPDELDQSAEVAGSMYCQGTSMSPREQLLKALMDLQQGVISTKDPSACAAAYATATRLIPTVKPKDEEDGQVSHATMTADYTGPICLAKAGDCAGAWALYQAVESKGSIRHTPTELREAFDYRNPRCKGK